MRQNLPVTQVEVPVRANQLIVSTTSARGVICHVNEHFLGVSGFSREEVMDQPHNIIRHPDMPSAVFAMMWNHLKAGEHWLGIVKNRCRNGDHYWVSAHVTPILSDGEIQGYESVRSAPRAGWVQRAESVYRRLRNGRSPISLWARVKDYLVRALPIMGIAGVLSSAVVWVDTGLLSHAIGLLVAFVPIALVCSWIMDRFFTPVDLCTARITQDPVTQYIYTGQVGNLARNRLKQLLDQASMTTVFHRVNESIAPVLTQSAELSSGSQKSATTVESLREETDQIAVAMEEMTSTIEEVSRSVVEVPSPRITAARRVASAPGPSKRPSTWSSASSSVSRRMPRKPAISKRPWPRSGPLPRSFVASRNRPICWP